MPIFEPDSDTVTGPEIAGAPEEEELRVDEIQGAVLPGFGTSLQHLFALRFPDAQQLRHWLAGPHGQVSTLAQVMTQRNRRRAALRRNESRPSTPIMRAVALSMPGLRLIRPDADEINDTPFKQGMRARAPFLGDPKTEGVEGHPSTWRFGGTEQTVPHLVTVLAAELCADLDRAADALRQDVADAILWEQRGSVLDGDIEHFGFRDGVSQLGVRGRLSSAKRHFMTRRWFDPADPRAKEYARPGQPLAWPGQFVFGYRAGDANHEDPLEPGPVKAGGPDWTKDGSLLVLRRLRQDVPTFQRFMVQEAARLVALPGFGDMSADKLAAKMVGRWPNGSALVRAPGGPDEVDASDMLCTNAFGYDAEVTQASVCNDPGVAREGLAARAFTELRCVRGAPADQDGLRCPVFAHIRKVNPRDRATDQGGFPLSTRRFQMMRRGITWGEKYEGGQSDDGDRGLLFMSYQTSIANQFEKLTLAWMNHEDPPESPSGYDLLVGQENDGDQQRRATLRSDDPAHPDATATIAAAAQWIVATGGEYFFAPSVSALALFAAPEAPIH